MESGHCKYSCETRAQTLEWINAIVDFVKPYSFLINAQVVNFFKVCFYPFALNSRPLMSCFGTYQGIGEFSFCLLQSDGNQTDDAFFLWCVVWWSSQDRLWEVVDGEWMDCLRMEPVENLLLIPSGVVQVPFVFFISLHLCRNK